MEQESAKMLLGLAPNSHPSQSQVKDAYRSKAWETHPDRFPAHLKSQAESNFKLVSEAYTTLLSSAGGATRRQSVQTAGASSYYSQSRVVIKTRVGRTQTSMIRVASLPFLFIIFGSLTLAASTASRAYKTQKEAHPSFNPFLP
ncbi:PREDICTED: uncharacterized protein LOC105955600 isoform X2 [Erythranthe guttata]|uniref:uncharacterized protein LOC105955600 isoform X2 n=1 Tax=Erythranthe guttata TaxID=4155 RepID=UPI00064DCEEB|nr:PREDICTED: uncharacterized protein LOC105955600 isoform X2 [Erythranthe guttata]|eukprot:XP_012834830.1 PREDICTED: uncharacterized protein LOC105955600 isoform X2 [Erythranthe guttata]